MNSSATQYPMSIRDRPRVVSRQVDTGSPAFAGDDTQK